MCLPIVLLDVILELVLTLDRILGHVGVGSELDGVCSQREGEKGSARAAVDQVVPVLEAYGRLIDQRRAQRRVQRQVGHLKVIDRGMSWVRSVKRPLL